MRVLLELAKLSRKPLRVLLRSGRKSLTELPIYIAIDPLLTHLTALAAQDHVAAQPLGDPMQLVSGVIYIVTPPSALLSVLEVLSAPHLATHPRPTTGASKAQISVRCKCGVFRIWGSHNCNRRS